MKTIKFSDNSSADIKIFSDFPELASLTVDLIKSGSVAVSGGSTFAKLYSHWLNLKPDCPDTMFFPVDERMVPFEDKDSNWGLAFEQFYKPLGREDVKETFTPTVNRSLEILSSHFGNSFPEFDVIFLGIGDDGHTASLFPGGDYLNDQNSIVLQTVSPKPPIDRITIGPAVLKKALNVITIIAGGPKKPIFERIEEADMGLPIVRMLSLREHSVLFVEKELL